MTLIRHSEPPENKYVKKLVATEEEYQWLKYNGWPVDDFVHYDFPRPRWVWK